MVVVVRRGPNRHPVARGVLIGGAVASSAHRKQEQQMQMNQMQREAQKAQQQAAEAKLEAEAAAAAAKAAEEAARAASCSTVAVTVAIPLGVQPGQQFFVEHAGQRYTVTCPANMAAGEPLTLNLPAPAAVPAVQVAASPVAAAAETGPAGREAAELVLVADHAVDETQDSIKRFGILSVSKGAKVLLVEGDLENGLGGAFKDYVRVQVPSQGGREGIISRLVVRVAEPEAPPSAIGADAPLEASAPPPAISF